MEYIAISVVVVALLALLCLLVLHFLSPEFGPSWRMISEYALGKHKWLITSFFLFWGISSILLAVLLWEAADSTWFKVGVAFLFLSGIGKIMGGLFDIKHKLHGASFALGVPSLPIAAMLLGYSLAELPAFAHSASMIIFASHATWISVVLMGAAMGVMIAGFKKAGIPMGPDIPPPTSVPKGVIALAGYANRLLVLAYLFWVGLVATLAV
jgi:hypothetical membrane protein